MCVSVSSQGCGWQSKSPANIIIVNRHQLRGDVTSKPTEDPRESILNQSFPLRPPYQPHFFWGSDKLFDRKGVPFDNKPPTGEMAQQSYVRMVVNDTNIIAHLATNLAITLIRRSTVEALECPTRPVYGPDT
ncbi:hypothetical protein DAPPUDRAFT_242675 [Daphnia pulex]|uniref:Uncharacterized protein n=1 Tax=Daphnia pulex TaxID=6669 RepID=E9GH75_DAPPU|nr:hypothetical protein DAPPUDRAFT_242675 [Daphnia pulex]|eukprot:EFX81235.1 hypothetical protein DAPPUDRAFT_242675 [Daphnia pulex]